MTITEEIQDAMRNGASSMFLYGLIVSYSRNPETTMQAIEMAAQRMLSQREVKLSEKNAQLDAQLARGLHR